jgi:tetratricopeptide (TPR) repeat protein
MTIVASAPDRVPGRRGAVPGWAELWQVPLFCLGVAALVTVLSFRPAEGDQGLPGRDPFEQMQAALDRGDVTGARRLLHRLVTNPAEARLTPEELKYLRGSVLLAEATKLHPLPCTKEEGHLLYRAAAAELQTVQAQGVKHLSPRLGFRLAVAKAGSTTIDTGLVQAIEQSLETNFTDRGAGYELVAALRVHLTPPDYMGAIRAIDQLLVKPHVTSLSALRLQKVKFLTQLKKWPEVDKAAAGIPGDAAEYAQALQLRAQAAYHLGLWGEAVNLFSQVPPRQMTPASLLFQGLSLQRLKKTPEAVRVWGQLWREHHQSPETVRARVSYAEILFDQSNWAETVACLEQVLREQKPEALENAYLTRDELQKLVVKVGERLIHLVRWPDLVKLAEAARPWRLDGKPELWLAWAWHAQAQTGTASLAPEQAYARAAEHAVRAAAHLSGAEKEALLMLAGQDALKAKAPQQAQRALGELLALNPDPNLKPLVMIELAEALFHLKQVGFACDRLREASRLPGPHEARARLRLAEILIAEKRYPEAALELEPAAALVTRPGAGKEAMSAAHRWALFLYHDVVVQRAPKLLQAIDAGEKALVYAASDPQATQTRYLLGLLLLQLVDPHRLSADVLRTEKTALEQRAARLWQAHQLFQATAEELAKSEVLTPQLDKTEAHRGARLRQADCLYYLGVLRGDIQSDVVPQRDVCYREAARLYQAMAHELDHSTEGLYALLFLAKCQKNTAKFIEARETLRNALELLDRLSDTDLARSVYGLRTREAWRQLLQAELDQVP